MVEGIGDIDVVARIHRESGGTIEACADRGPIIAAEADALRAEVEAFDNETRELETRAAQKAARDARYAARKQRRK